MRPRSHSYCARSQSKARGLTRNIPGGANLGRANRKDRGVSGRRLVVWSAVFRMPGGARAAHVMQFRPIGADHVAGKFTPKGAEETAEHGEWAGYQGKGGTRNSQDGSTHNAAPTRPGGPGWPVPRGRPVGARGSWKVMMAAKRLKTGTRKVDWRHFPDQPFQRFTGIADTDAGL